MQFPIPKCVYCKHFNHLEWNCMAYTGGIPEEILTGEIDHTKPYKGDNGIQFEPIEGQGD